MATEDIPKLKNPRFIATLEEHKHSSIRALLDVYGKDHYLLMMKLISLLVLKPSVAGRLWAECLGCSYVNPLQSTVVPSFTDGLPLDVAERYNAIHLYSINGVASVCMLDPTDRETVYYLSDILKKRISPSFGFHNKIKKAIEYAKDPMAAERQSDLVAQSEITAQFKAKRKRAPRNAVSLCA